MTETQRFKSIQKIADKKERDAATAFGQSLRDRESAKQRLEELQHYHAEYVQRFSNASRSGISGAQIHEYQAFIAKLEEAIEQQRRVVKDKQGHCKSSKTHWQGKLSKARAVDNAVQRLREQEIQAQERREQRINDDRAPRKS